MSITVIYSKDETDHTISLAKKKLLLIPIVFVTLFVTGLFVIQSYYQKQLAEFKVSTLYERDISKDKYLKQIKTESTDKLMFLSKKLGELESEVTRLNALGENVIKKTGLPKKEFNFSMSDKELAENSAALFGNEVDPYLNLLEKLDGFHLLLKEKKNQFNRLDITLNSHHIKKELYISGYPVRGPQTWLSSHFGTRKDPFSGKLRSHKGVDIAGPEGTVIHATSAGVVVWAGPRSGYGIMVELNHGGGFVTRYAHARAVNVSVGEVVAKGQQVAEMGSTGRSTGPHVHYEILKNGRQIKPDYYLYRKTS